MIIYRRRGLAKHGILCHCKGTVIFRTFPWAVMSGIIAFFLSYYQWPQCSAAHDAAHNTCGLKHPSPFTWYFSLSTFMISFNSSNAYTRYWEARTHLQTTSGALALLGNHVTTFCTPSILHERKRFADGEITEDEMKEKLENIAVFKAKSLHMITLLHALMMMYFLNQDWCERMEILGGLTYAESQALSSVNDQVYLVESWLSELFVNGFQSSNILSKPPNPPTVSRLWATLESLMMGFLHACKVEDTPFPYPYQQLMGIMAAVNTFLIPYFATQFIWDPVHAVIVSALLSFLYRAIYETILMAELPFGSKPNDLPFRLVHHRFVKRMTDLVDKDTFAMLKEWNLLFALSEVIVCRDGITTFAPWTNRRTPMYELLNHLDGTSDDESHEEHHLAGLRTEVHDIWKHGHHHHHQHGDANHRNSFDRTSGPVVKARSNGRIQFQIPTESEMSDGYEYEYNTQEIGSMHPSQEFLNVPSHKGPRGPNEPKSDPTPPRLGPRRTLSSLNFKKIIGESAFSGEMTKHSIAKSHSMRRNSGDRQDPASDNVTMRPGIARGKDTVIDEIYGLNKPHSGDSRRFDRFFSSASNSREV